MSANRIRNWVAGLDRPRLWQSATLGFGVAYIPVLVFIGSNDIAWMTPEVFGLVFFFAFLGALWTWTNYVGRFLWFGFAVAMAIDLSMPERALNLLTIIVVGVAAGLLARLLADNWRIIGSATVGVMVISLVIFPVQNDNSLVKESGDWSAQATLDAPVIVHLVLDGHVGSDVLRFNPNVSSAEADQLDQFYLDRGFTVYPAAFSEYFLTHAALNHLVNFRTEASRDIGIGGRTGHFELKENAYFSALSDRGYQLHINQTNYLDYCSARGLEFATCRTFPAISLGGDFLDQLSAVDRVTYGVRAISSNSFTLRSIMMAPYYMMFFLGIEGGADGLWRWEDWPGVSANSLETLDLLASELAAAKPGEFYFAHVLLPHGPYVFDDRCQLRAPRLWRKRHSPVRFFLSEPALEADIKERLSGYLGQMHCVQRKLDGIISALDKAVPRSQQIFIIHGDHGWRISPHDSLEISRDDLSLEDIMSNHGTLFAFRAPGIEATTVREPVAIHDLFPLLYENDFAQLPVLQNDRELGVYLSKPFLQVGEIKSFRWPAIGKRD